MTNDVLIFVEGKVGRIRMNRPRALHALNTAMCASVLDALNAWADDVMVEAVLIDHAEGQGFCVGGDIRVIAESGKGDGSAAREFFHVEYRLNHCLFTFAKPIVAFMDGITMRGGVGISQPAKYCVATENTKCAMPETAIGMFPDVGGGWYISRLPGRMGQYLALNLALTSHRLDGAERLALGLATNYLPSPALDEVKAQIIADPRAIETVLTELAVPAPDAAVLALRGQMDRLFAADRLEDVLAALEADGGGWAAAQLETLNTRSPLAMKVTLKLLLDTRPCRPSRTRCGRNMRTPAASCSATTLAKAYAR